MKQFQQILNSSQHRKKRRRNILTRVNYADLRLGMILYEFIAFSRCFAGKW